MFAKGRPLVPLEQTGWHALRYSEGRAFSQRRSSRPSEYLRACHHVPPYRGYLLNHAQKDAARTEVSCGHP
jgi:hypothetical protein